MFYTRGIFNDHITQKVRDIFNKKSEVVEEGFTDHRELGKKGRIKFKKLPSVGEYIDFYDKNGNKQYGQINKYTGNGSHIHINQHGKETHKLEVIKEASTEELDESNDIETKIMLHPRYASAQTKYDHAMATKDVKAAKKHRQERDLAYKELKQKFSKSVKESTEELDEATRVDYKKVGDTHYHRKDKGTWVPLPKHIEVKKVGDAVHVRKNKGTWVPQKHATFMEEVENTDDVIEENIEQLDEVIIDHSRFIRSHGKRPRSSGSGTWMYTNKPYGEVDYKNPKEFHQTKNGEDHKKSVKAWAKEHGHGRVYTMESSEFADADLEPVNEISKKTLGSYVNKAAHDIDNKAYVSGKEDAHANYGLSVKMNDKVQKRKAGIKKAVNKLTKEEIQMIENHLNILDESTKLSNDLSKGYHTIHIGDSKTFEIGNRTHVKSHGDDVKAGLSHVKSVNNVGNNYAHKLVYHDGKGNFYSTHHEKGTPINHFIQRAK